MYVNLFDFDFSRCHRYVECDQKLQEEFVSVMDDLGDSGDFDYKLFRCVLARRSPSLLTQSVMNVWWVCRYMRGCKWLDTATMGGANSKLKSKQVHKLGMRFIEKYGLKLGEFGGLVN